MALDKIKKFCAEASGTIAVLSVIALHFKSSIAVATWTAICFYTICIVLCMFKTLTKAKIDLDDQEIEFESEKQPETPPPPAV